MNAPKGGGGGKSPQNNNRGGNQGGNGGGNLRYGAFGGYKGVPRKKAEQFVGADIRRLKRDTHNEVKHERRQFRRERGDIKHVARQTGMQLRQLKQNTNQAYSGALDASNAAQAALQNTISQNSGATQGAANSELARLGLTGSDATAQMGADAANAQNVAAQGSANNAANLGLAQANAGALSNLMIGTNRGERMSQLGQARNMRDENISQLHDALREAQAGRGDSVRALLDQMAQTGWAQHMQQAQLALQRHAINVSGSPYAAGGYSSYSSPGYSTSGYQQTYGYGYSSPGGSSGSSYSGGSAANAAKLGLYRNLMGTTP